MTREQVAQARLKAAAEHVENAQHELERAVSALADLNWMQPEMDKVGNLRDRIHEAWYRLAPISHVRAKACAKATLDREPATGDEDPHKGCCAGYRVNTVAATAFKIVCATCGAGSLVPAGSIDVTTSGATDAVCGKCSGAMVLA